MLKESSLQAFFLKRIKYLYRLIFCASNESEHLYQLAWNDCLFAVQKLNSEPLRHILDLTLSLGALRYRLEDPSVFTMSELEFKVIFNTLISYINHPSGKSLNNLESAIQNFEELYHNTLQTVVKDPSVLQFFIEDLYTLKKAWEKTNLFFSKWAFIAANIYFLRKPSKGEFQSFVIKLMRDLFSYFNALMSGDLEQIKLARKAVEKREKYFPHWVFKRRFNPTLKPSQYYFLTHIGRVTEILFAMDVLLKQQDSPTDLRMSNFILYLKALRLQLLQLAATLR